MADRPILFSAPMVRAILREIEQPGTGKTQTRRVLNPQPSSHMPGMWRWNGPVSYGGHISVQADAESMAEQLRIHASRYRVDDRLYVRETLQAASNDQGKRWWSYAADGKDVWPLTEWIKARDSVPSIHMPRWASRITLIVTDVRVQRLQEISEADAIAEGIVQDSDGWRDYQMPGTQCCVNARAGFRTLWDSLNASRGYGWDTNPWVAAYTFRPILGNIDQVRS